MSVTTRQPRPGEKDGREYFFVTEAAFHAMRRRGELVEWAEVHGHFYGTPRSRLEQACAAGRDMLLDIDVQGAMAVRRRFRDAVLIFIATPTFGELEKRLRARHSEGEAQIQRRLSDARRELKFLAKYDYQVINDRLPRALGDLQAILTAETLRIRRYQKEK